MMKFLLSLPLILALSACHGTQLGQLSHMDADSASSPYHTALFDDYLALSQMEYDEGDYRDSDSFAMKAMATLGQEAVAPDEVDSRHIPDNHVTEMTYVHDQIATALQSGGADIAPVEMSRAVSHFDCWLQEQEENFQPPHIERCRAITLSALDKVLMALKDAHAPDAQTHIVFFRYNRADLKDGAPEVVEEVASLMQEFPAYNAHLYAHADAPGSINYNQSLSERRGKMVKDALVSYGIDAGRIKVKAYGEKKPMVTTAKGARELKNRRVEIILSAE